MLAAIVLGGGFLWATSIFRDNKSTTVDETVYLRGGLEIYWNGSFRVLNENGVAPLPILLSYWLPAMTHEPDRRPFNSRFPSMGELGDRAWVGQARLVSSAVIGLPLVLTVYVWLYRRRGLGVACAGGLLMAASPLMLSHGALATTDACFALTTLLALAAMARYHERPTTASLLLMSCASGAVIATKYSGLFILPLAGLTLLAAHWPRKPGLTRKQTVLASINGAAVALPFFLSAIYFVILISHGFDPTGAWEGLQFQLAHAEQGHRAYLFGENSTHGWWFYYPVVFAAKSSEAELALLLIFLGATGWRIRKLDWHRRDFAFVLWLCSMTLYGASVLMSSISNGPRYLMVLYALMILAALDSLSLMLAQRPRWLTTVCVTLVAAQLAASALSAPHWLAYYNLFVGGPERGHELLISDNLDWGQDLPGLRVALEDLHCERVSLIYFGTARFEDYGIKAHRYRQSRGHFEDYDCLAISENNLHSLFAPYPEFAALRALEPAGRAGHSIRIFKPADPEVAKALELAPGL